MQLFSKFEIVSQFTKKLSKRSKNFVLGKLDVTIYLKMTRHYLEEILPGEGEGKRGETQSCDITRDFNRRQLTPQWLFQKLK